MEVQADARPRRRGLRSVRVKRELEGGWFQWVSMPLPAVLTIQSGINQLRYATLKGIMAAKKKEIQKGLGPAGVAGTQRIVALYLPEKGEEDADHRAARRPRPPESSCASCVTKRGCL